MLKFLLTFFFFTSFLIQAQEKNAGHIDTLAYNSGWIRVVTIQHIKYKRIYFTYTNSKEEEVEQSIGLNMLKFYRNRDTTGKLVKTKDISQVDPNKSSVHLAILKMNNFDFFTATNTIRLIGILEES